MEATLITIGNEVLLGFVADTNAAYLAGRLAELGILISKRVIIGDNLKEIEKTITENLRKTDLIIATGGLGPTPDDKTRNAIARVFNKPLSLNQKVFQKVKQHFAERGTRPPETSITQALIPKGVRILKNRFGMAPGLFIEKDRKMFFGLPGVPLEMKTIFEEEMVPILKTKTKAEIVRWKTLRTYGITESQIASLIEGIAGSAELAFLPNQNGVDLRIMIKGKEKKRVSQRLHWLEKRIREKLGEKIYGVAEETLEEVIGRLLWQKKKTLAIAESCTGGLIGDRITNVPGSSNYFLGGVVAYSNEVKQKILGVPAEILRRYGAVSAQTAKKMAYGVRRLLNADIGLGITGIAGPSGSSNEKPIGLVYISLNTKEQYQVEWHKFLGTRKIIKQKFAQAGLDLIRRYLLINSKLKSQNVK
ncbi:MAG: competence/damage-inducible protein A [Candidatus Edwardsbacteria bacterium]